MKVVANTIKGTGYSLDRVLCGSCQRKLVIGDGDTLKQKWRYCPFCGEPIDWTDFRSRYAVE